MHLVILQYRLINAAKSHSPITAIFLIFKLFYLHWSLMTLVISQYRLINRLHNIKLSFETDRSAWIESIFLVSIDIRETNSLKFDEPVAEPEWRTNGEDNRWIRVVMRTVYKYCIASRSGKRERERGVGELWTGRSMPRGGCTMQADRIVASARCTRAIINNFVNNDDERIGTTRKRFWPVESRTQNIYIYAHRTKRTCENNR